MNIITEETTIKTVPIETIPLIENTNEDLIKEMNDILKSWKLDAYCVAVKKHRHFSFYDIKLGNKCRLSQLQKYSSEIGLNLKANSEPIFKVIQREGIVRIQLTTEEPELLPLLDLLKNNKVPKGILSFLLGETDEGKLLWTDFANNPHTLIAGSTGSGKSIFLHNIIANALHLKNVKLFLVDPKGVEFAPYDDAKINNIVQVATDQAKITEMLDQINEIMDERYELLKELKFQSVEECPDLFAPILILVDEVADLILKDGKEKKFQNTIVKLAQKSRAAGIYCVLATQHPIVKVITSILKANFMARVSMKVASRVDSQVIIDKVGAEALVGKGDALIKNYENDYVRFQTAYINPHQILEMINERKN